MNLETKIYLKVNPPNKAFSNQNNGHLGSRNIHVNFKML